MGVASTGSRPLLEARSGMLLADLNRRRADETGLQLHGKRDTYSLPSARASSDSRSRRRKPLSHGSMSPRASSSVRWTAS